VTRTRLLIALTTTAVAMAAVLLGGALNGGSTAGPVPAADPVQRQLGAGFAAGDTQALVARLQAGLRAGPKNAHGYALLGLAYQQRARETGDAAYYTKSDEALHRALSLAPGDLIATGALGSLALSRHRFREAVALGRRAQRISPTTVRTYGVIGDALVELGRYRDAFRAFDRMVTLKPDLSSYARYSYSLELRGNRRGAIKWMGFAQDAARGQAEPFAWSSVQLGKLYWNQGRVDDAAREFRLALQVFPGYVYALDALAQVAAARANLRQGISLESAAVARIPLPQFVAVLGDLYRAAGDTRRARDQYATIAVIERLLHANGVRTDLETALFDADHGRASVALARRARAQRPSIDGDDVLAWTLARSGRCGEGRAWSVRALRLGTQDALKFFHRAAIESCLGNRGDARAWARRALALNPHFSLLWAHEARRLAA
jgi:tetratricopeptide (TPR) repeat protein